MSEQDGQVAPIGQYAATPTRNGRHRRTASELIGVNGAKKTEDVGLASSLPHSLPATPNRGHRHRRSAALSIHESSGTNNLSLNLHDASLSEKPPSTPVLDCDMPKDDDSHPTSTASSPGYLQNFENRGSALRTHRPFRPPGVRVGFSDKTEIIPRRPLSTISSETEGSISTSKRLSTADSISSITSGLNELSKNNRSPLATTFEDDFNRPRPHTADSVLGRPSSQTLRKFPSWNSLKLSRKAKVLETAQGNNSPIVASIQKATIPSSPLALNVTDVELSENFDEDPTSAVASDYPVFAFPSSCPTSSSLRVHDWMQDDFKDNDGSMIDLDAALDVSGGNMKSPHSRSFSSARYSMHSQARMSGLPTSSVQYHRRTESAPQLAFSAVDRPPIRRLNSNSATEEKRRFEMENVFEEDETDAIESTRGDKAKLTDNSTPHQCQITSFSSTEVIEDDLLSQSPAIEAQTSSHQPAVSSPLIFAADDIIIVGDNNVHCEATYMTSSGSTVTSLENECNTNDGKSSIPPLTLSQPMMNPSHVTFYESGPASECSFSTTGLSGTAQRVVSNKISFTDSQRLNPPSSSDGYRNNERQSVDDVPSLVGSGSTMTSYIRQASTSSPSIAAVPASTHSACSIKSEAQQPRRNRSSMASLSRLMGGSFGAKSSLSVNMVADYSVTPSTAQREKRAWRFSRLFKFWRAKQGDTT